MEKLIFKNSLLIIFTLGVCLLFNACEKEKLNLSEESLVSQLENMPPKMPEVTDPRKLESILSSTQRSTQTVTLNQGWNYITSYLPSQLNQGDISITIKPNQNVSFHTFAIPSWSTVQYSYVYGNTSKTHVLKSSTLPSGQQKLLVYIKSTVSNNSCTITTTSSSNNNNNCSAPFPTSFRVGIDGGNPIDSYSGANIMSDAGQGLWGHNRYKWIDDSDARFVRINFYKPKNYGSGTGWISTYYDDIVDTLLCRGIPIYAVVTDVVGGTNVAGRETSYPTSGTWNQQIAWIDNYVAGLSAIVNHFGSKISIYETFNEPNAYAEGGIDNRAAMSPTRFAYLLRKAYNSVGNQVTLVSGPVLAHDHGPYAENNTNPCNTNVYDNGACYLRLAIEANGGNPYFDAVGYHIYVKANETNKYVIENGVMSSIGALRLMLNLKNLGHKKVHISEIGWDSNHINEWHQSNNMKYAIDKLRAVKNANKIASICHFAIADFPGKSYGLIRPAYMSGAKKKASFDNFRYNIIKQ